MASLVLEEIQICGVGKRCKKYCQRPKGNAVREDSEKHEALLTCGETHLQGGAQVSSGRIPLRVFPSEAWCGERSPVNLAGISGKITSLYREGNESLPASWQKKNAAFTAAKSFPG